MFIYYLILKKIVRKDNTYFHTLLIIFLSVITFQNNVFADAKKQQSAEEIRVEAFAEQQKGNLKSALSLYTKSLQLKPNQPQVLNDMGVVFEQMGLLNEAEFQYLEAIKVNPHYLPAYMNLAYFYQKKGDTVKALEYFQKRVGLGRSDDLWTLKAKEEIDKIYEGLLKVEGPFKREQKKVVQIQAEHLAQELVAKARKESQERFLKSEEYFIRGQKLSALKKYKEAIKEYDRALVLLPDNPKIIEAKENAQEELNREYIRLRIEHAVKLLELGDSASAKEEFRKILTIIPNEPFQKPE